MNPIVQSRFLPIVMLILSNLFMTVAWYGHLKFKSSPLWRVVIVSWGIVFFEYWLAVPANRWGNAVYSATELKILQEVITLSVFCGFAVVYLGKKCGGIIGLRLCAFWPPRPLRSSPSPIPACHRKEFRHSHI